MILSPHEYHPRFIKNHWSTTHIQAWLPSTRHHNQLLIRNRSWILTIHKARILRKKPIEKTFLDFKKWVKSIQTTGYNSPCMVLYFPKWCPIFDDSLERQSKNKNKSRTFWVTIYSHLILILEKPTNEVMLVFKNPKKTRLLWGAFWEKSHSQIARP